MIGFSHVCLCTWIRSTLYSSAALPSSGHTQKKLKTAYSIYLHISYLTENTFILYFQRLSFISPASRESSTPLCACVVIQPEIQPLWFSLSVQLHADSGIQRWRGHSDGPPHGYLIRAIYHIYQRAIGMMEESELELKAAKLNVVVSIIQVKNKWMIFINTERSPFKILVSAKQWSWFRGRTEHRGSPTRLAHVEVSMCMDLTTSTDLQTIHLIILYI